MAPSLLLITTASFIVASSGHQYAGSWLSVETGSKSCNALNFGAKGDGVTDDTKAVQAAIMACTAGGTTLLPAGYTFLTFALSVPKTASSFALIIDGTLLFSNVSSKWPGSVPCLDFLGGSNIVLAGSGVVDGNGAAWWPNRANFRPGLVTTSSVSSMLIANLTFRDSPNHQLEIYASPTEIVGVSILAPSSTSPTPSHNTDGIDIHGDSFWVHGSYISTGDDNVAIHASNVRVSDCRFGTGHGASIGSLGGAIALQNITVTDVTFNGTGAAVRIKTDTGSTGFLKDVTYSNLQLEGVQESVTICMFYDVNGACNYPGHAGGGSSKTTLAITNVVVANVTAHNSAQAGQLTCDKNAPCGSSISISGVVHSGAAPQPWACANAAVAKGAAGNVPALPSACT